MIIGRTGCAISVLAAAVLFGVSTAIAAGFPERPVRLIVGTSPGGGTDAIARLVAKSLTTTWGQAVVVDNRPGVEGMIGMDAVAKSTPDGHTLGINNVNHTIRPHFYKNQPFDTIKSFTPIILLASAPDVILVNPALSPVKSLQELIALAKSKPRQLNYATAGQGTAPSMEMANFAQRVGIEMVEVHYKGTGPALVALLTGEVQVGFAAIAAISGHIRAGRLKPLASGSKARHPLMPDVPTVAEAANLPGFEAANWYGIIGPARLPARLAHRLHDDFLAAIKSLEVAEGLTKQGFLINTLGPAEFRQYMIDDVAKWAATVKALGAR